MRTPPPILLDQALIGSALAAGWRLDLPELVYVPKGAGSYHWAGTAPDGRRWFVTVDDLDEKPWLGTEHTAVFEALQAAYDTAARLAEAGLASVVAPRRTPDGATAVRLAGQYSLSVFPFVDGEAGQWGEPVAQADRAHLLVLLAGLHRCTPLVTATAPPASLGIAHRPELEASLRDLPHRWRSGPLAEQARQELTAGARVVRDWLATYDELAARTARLGPDLVVTHGEPHPGNVIRRRLGSDSTADSTGRSGAASLAVVDWDTAGLAPPERDLWMFDDGSPSTFDPYATESGRRPDSETMTLYRLRWTLDDVACATTTLRSPHGLDEESQRALGAVHDLLAFGCSTPYGPVPGPRIL